MSVRTLTAVTLALTTAACTRGHASGDGATVDPGGVSGSIEGAHVVGATPVEDGQWTLPGKDLANRRFSGLDAVNTGNVASLRLAWTFSTGIGKGHVAAPLVVGGKLYVVTPFPDRIHAIDLAHPEAGAVWTYDPHANRRAQGAASAGGDVVDYGATFADGALFTTTLDAHAIAIDAATGEEKWNVALGDVTKGETMTVPPLVVKGKVIVGNDGSDFGVRGWLAALDENTGQVVWKAYATGPDAECLLGPSFHPFYAPDRGTDLGVMTWPPGKWTNGGGAASGFASYDPELDLLYYGTGHPAPWNPEARQGDDKWTSGICARRPDDGQAVWWYGTSPHDPFAYGAVNEDVLVDLDVKGQTRHALLHADANGTFYVLDRASGEVLSAAPFARVTTSRGVDAKTGRLRWFDEKSPGYSKVVRDACPAASGAKNRQAMSFSPATGLVYLPHDELCEDAGGVDTNYVAGTPYLGVDVKMSAHRPDSARGEICAWDPVAGKKVWAVTEDLPVWSGALATAGGLVFYGTLDGWLKALDAKTGALLWKFRTTSGIVGQPIAFRGPDGKEYVAVLAGVGAWAGAVVSNELDVHDATAAWGFANAVPGLAARTKKGGALYVFALP